MMIYDPQPIKCVEAVFLALYLTAGILDVERIPLGFKSERNGQVHQHIVLLVKHNGRFGAIGMSRQQNLMNKEFEFESISSIVNNYKKAYEQSQHRVLRIRVGLPVEHNIESFYFVCWRYLSFDPSSSPWEQCLGALERHATQAKRLWDRWLLDGQRQDNGADMCLKNVRLEKLTQVGDRQRMRITGSGEQESHVKIARKVVTENTCKHATKLTVKTQMEPLSPVRKCSRDLPFSSRRCLRCQGAGDGPALTKLLAAIHARNCEKVAMKCYSLELMSGSCKRLGMHTEKKKHKIRSRQSRKLQQYCTNGKYWQNQVLI